PHMPLLPPRDAADAESSELVLSSPPQAAPPGRGIGQLFRPAGGAVVTLCAPAGGFVSGRDHRPHAGLAGAKRQFLMAELSAHDDARGKSYEFRGKPGDPHRMPRQYAPYHLRLDWLMWFAAMESPFRHQWFIAFVVKLLEGDRATLKLLRHNPFPDHPPGAVR